MLQLPHTLVYFGLLSITPCSTFLSMVSVFCIPHIMRFMLPHACLLHILLSWYSDGNLVIQRCIGRTRGERSFWRVNVAKQCRFTSGGYSFCWNADYFKNARGALQHVYTICWAGVFQCRQIAYRWLQSDHSYTSCLHLWPAPWRHRERRHRQCHLKAWEPNRGLVLH